MPCCALIGTRQIRASVEKLEELYALPQEPAPAQKVSPTFQTAGADVAFEDVGFHYERGFGIEHLSFAVQPRLIVLDEATAALDAITEQKVRQALDHVRVGRTALVVAHRLTTVLRADRILVIADGRMMESRSPRELWSRHGMFYELCQAQEVALG
jgi:ABC-type multidrug transport system fused ATPase/permease subunit